MILRILNHDCGLQLVCKYLEKNYEEEETWKTSSDGGATRE